MESEYTKAALANLWSHHLSMKYNKAVYANSATNLGKIYIWNLQAWRSRKKSSFKCSFREKSYLQCTAYWRAGNAISACCCISGVLDHSFLACNLHINTGNVICLFLALSLFDKHMSLLHTNKELPPVWQKTQPEVIYKAALVSLFHAIMNHLSR